MGTVDLAKKTRSKADPIALATKGRQTSYEAEDASLRTRVRVVR